MAVTDLVGRCLVNFVAHYCLLLLTVKAEVKDNDDLADELVGPAWMCCVMVEYFVAQMNPLPFWVL